MGLIDKLTESPYGLKGQTPSKLPGADKASTLHNTTSINNTPEGEYPASTLDLNGKIGAKYVDNLPK